MKKITLFSELNKKDFYFIKKTSNEWAGIGHFKSRRSKPDRVFFDLIIFREDSLEAARVVSSETYIENNFTSDNIYLLTRGDKMTKRYIISHLFKYTYQDERSHSQL